MTGNRQESKAAASGSAGRPLILLVKNEVLWRSQVAAGLRDRGYKVVEAAHAAEARTLLHLGLRPCLLFSDLKMPGRVKGCELAKLCKGLFPGVPVLVAAAARDAALPDDADFLEKPYSFEELFAAVSRLIGEP